MRTKNHGNKRFFSKIFCFLLLQYFTVNTQENSSTKNNDCQNNLLLFYYELTLNMNIKRVITLDDYQRVRLISFVRLSDNF